MHKSIGKVRAWLTPGTKWFVCWWLAVMLMATACVPPGSAPRVMPESPLIPGTNVALVQNRWRVVEIIYQAENVAFDVIQPIYVSFTIDGQLLKRATHCNAVGYYIVAHSEQRYQLVQGAGTARGCGAIGEKQDVTVGKALRATTKYEMHGTQLFLTGDDVRIVLEIDNAP